MSILDGAFAEDVIGCASAILGPLADIAVANMDLTPRQKKALAAARKGIPLAAVLNVDRAQRDAMFVRGGELLKMGRIEDARNLLTLLVALQPTDARVIYALALTYQIPGEFEVAAKLLLFFVALDATNPDGHLRLGECLLSAREYDDAKACFLTAARLCEQGHGSPRSREHAARMIAHVDEIIREPRVETRN